jgi:hypothetical protein
MSTANNARRRKDDVIRMNKEGKYLLNPSQLGQVRVNVPNAFIQAGVSIALVQTPAGIVNVGLTHDFDVGKLKPIDDLGKLFQIKKIVSGPEARKEKRENRQLLQNFVFNTMVDKSIKTDDLVVRNGLDAELVRYVHAVEILEENEVIVLAAARTCELDKYLVSFVLNQMDRAHVAIMDFLMSYVSDRETEKKPFKDFLMEAGVTQWVYSKVAQSKIEIGRDQPFWTLFYKTSMEKSIVLTVEEVEKAAIKEAYANYPGFAEVYAYVAQTVPLLDKELTQEVKGKIKLYMHPVGLEYELLQRTVVPARPTVDVSPYKEYSKIWNLSRLGLLGIANPDGSREDLFKQLFGVDISDEEKLDIPKIIRDLGPDFMLKGPLLGTEESVSKFFRNVGIPSRLNDLVKAVGPFIFPKQDDKKENDQEVIFTGVPIGIRTRMAIPPVKRLEIKPSLRQMTSVIRRKDDFETFERSPYYVRNLSFDVKAPKLRGAGTAFTKKAIGLLEVVKKSKECSYLSIPIGNFLGTFKLPEMMDLASDEIYNQLRSKAYLDFEDDQPDDIGGLEDENPYEDL